MSIIGNLEHHVNYIRNNPGDVLYKPDDVRSLISQAEREGIDVTRYKIVLPELDTIYAKGRLEYFIRCQRREPGDSFYAPARIRELIEKARRFNVDVSQYETQLPELDILYAIGGMERYIETCIKYPNEVLIFFDSLMKYRKLAKGLGVDISVYDTDVCRIKKAVIEKNLQRWREEG